MNPEAILERLIRKIEWATVDTEPTENIFMDDLFDAPLYAKILKHLPARSAYQYDPDIHPDARRPDGTVTRGVVMLPETGETSSMQPEDRDFWKFMTEVLTADALRQTILRKFQTSIRAQWGDALPELVTVPILSRDSAGYFLRVHPDTPSRIATMQFYFPADDSQLHLGTSFHVRDGDGFRLLKKNPFKPNSAYAFARTDTSWHSVERMGPEERDRNTLALTFFIKGQEYRPGQRYR